VDDGAKCARDKFDRPHCESRISAISILVSRIHHRFLFAMQHGRRAPHLELAPRLRHSSMRCCVKKPLQWENRTMDALKGLKHLIGALTEVGLMLLALAIVAALLVGGAVPFFGNVVTNITSMVKDLGQNGLVGLIALGLILWLFSKRSVA
jgi:hypothetical protein